MKHMNSSSDFAMQTRRICEKFNLWDLRSPVIIALSGGMDSMALLHVFLQIAHPSSPPVFTAHLDHAARTESAEEARWVRKQSENLGVPCFIDRLDISADKSLSQEAYWRRERYLFLERIRQQCHAVSIATAHTADDQVETVIFRLLTGTGPRGVSGMHPENDKRIIIVKLQRNASPLIRNIHQNYNLFL